MALFKLPTVRKEKSFEGRAHIPMPENTPETSMSMSRSSSVSSNSSFYLKDDLPPVDVVEEKTAAPLQRQQSVRDANRAKTVVLITGCSSGIGKELTLQLIKDEKYIVFASMRSKMSAKGKSLMRECENAEAMLNILELDVTDPESISAAVKRVLQLVGRIDVLVNNAAYGMVGPVETQSLAEVKKMFDTNFFGVLNLIQEVLPGMRTRRKGRIINVTGLHGVVGRSFEACYSASKFALEGLTSSMAPMYKKFGVHICTVAPGFVSSAFARNSKQPALSANPQTGHMDWSNVPNDLIEPFGTYLCSTMLSNKQHSQSSLKVAQFLERVINDPSPKLRYETSQNPTVKKAFDIGRGADRDGSKLLEYSSETCLAEKTRVPVAPVKPRTAFIGAVQIRQKVAKRIRRFSVGGGLRRANTLPAL